jgi:antitoxin component of RelBE/YafQ-DinJ toxin-antitoxin module
MTAYVGCVDPYGILDQIGLSPSDAIRMSYRQVTLCKGLPFDARIPSATTRKALRDAEAGRPPLPGAARPSREKLKSI